MNPQEAAARGYVTVYAHPNDADQPGLDQLRQEGASVVLSPWAARGQITYSTGTPQPPPHPVPDYLAHRMADALDRARRLHDEASTWLDELNGMGDELEELNGAPVDWHEAYGWTDLAEADQVLHELARMVD